MNYVTGLSELIDKIYILGHVVILESNATPECSFHVIMFVGPLRDALSFGDLCSVYKAGCLSEFGPWEKASVAQTQRTKATQQDLGNHIQLCKTNGIGYVPHSSTPRIGHL